MSPQIASSRSGVRHLPTELIAGRVQGICDQSAVPLLVLARERQGHGSQVVADASASPVQGRPTLARIIQAVEVPLETRKQGLLKVMVQSGLQVS